MMKGQIEKFTVQVTKVEKGSGYGIFPTGTVVFSHPKTGVETCISMRTSLAGVNVGDTVEIDWEDIGGWWDAIKGARIVAVGE